MMTIVAMARRVAAASAVLLALMLAADAEAQNRWSGVSLGVSSGSSLNGGGGATSAPATTVTVGSGYFASTSVAAIAESGERDLRPKGYPLAGHVGYARQMGRLVAGVEADFGVMGLKGSKSVTTVYPCCAPTGFTIAQSVEAGALVMVRPRIGIAAGPVFVYGTGGLAMTEMTYAAQFSDTYFDRGHAETSVTERVRATVYGGGAEIGGRVSFKIEYLWARFPEVAARSTNFTVDNYTPSDFYRSQRTFEHTVTLRAGLFRAGVNFRF